MTRCARRSALLTSSILGFLVACSERFPRRIEPAPPAVVPATPIGLDARPVSATCVQPFATTRPTAKIGLARVTTAPLDRPVEIAFHAGRMYVLELGGRVRLLAPDGATSTVVLDVSAEIVASGEAGLLGIAWSPRFAESGFVYLYYTAKSPEPAPAGTVFESAVVRYRSPDGGLTLDPASAKRILTVDQPFTNHNGGTIAFGPDGMLYVGLGDGGSGGDPRNLAQDPGTLLGKILRIDVERGDPYSVPGDNPFVAGGARAEIYALGFRNPYRFRFDAVTGALWAGDVGQGQREEIDRVVAGGNYGWRVREGKTCYEPREGCATAGFLEPVVDHDREDAWSITGGVVYRGSALPALAGKYVYGDYGTGRMWAIGIDEAAPAPERLDEGLERVNPTAYAIDPGGEIVFTDYASDSVLRIVPPRPPPGAPEKLTETGCVDSADPGRPAAGLFPYDVNVAQWIDGATADRFLAIPDGATLGVDERGSLVLPPGGIAIRTIRAERRRIETQLVVHRPDTTWEAYNYVWSEDQKDATLVREAGSVTLPSGRRHVVLDGPGCTSCHELGSSPTIGLEPAQLDRDDVTYGGERKGNPLATLEKLGMVAAVPRETYRRLPREEGASAERRARGYLHANCAFCHRGDRGMDLRFTTALGDMRVCDVPGTSAAGGRVLLAPSDPEESQILRAMRTAGPGRMPPVASLVPDPAGTALVASWITSVGACK